MSDMIEKVARALCADHHKGDGEGWPFYERDAQTAIQAHTAALVEGAGDLIQKLLRWEERTYGPQGKQVRVTEETLSQAAATITALTAELARVKRTLTDPQRLIWRNDVEGICETPDICFEHGDHARCGPCAIKQACARGVEPDLSLPNLPEVYRLRRQLATAREEGVRLGIEAAAREADHLGGDRVERNPDGSLRSFDMNCKHDRGDAVLNAMRVRAQTIAKSIRALDAAAIARRDAALSDLIAGDADLIDGEPQ